MIVVRAMPVQEDWPAGRSVYYVEIEADVTRCSDCGAAFGRGRHAYAIYDRNAPARIVHPRGKCRREA